MIPLLVCGLEGFGDLPRDRQHVVRGNRAAGDPIGERCAVDQLEDQRLDAVRLLDTVDSGNVWMVQRGEHLSFAPEAREPVGIE